MAKKNLQDTAKIITQSFVKGLNKDSDPSYISEGMWTHAINAVNNTIEGDVGSLSNETSNYLCETAGATMPFTAVSKYIIGAVYLYSDKWIIYTAGHNSLGQPVMSEIGLLEEDLCTYRPIVQDSCLGFDKRYLISGASREKEDCTWQIYWADGLNPDRFLNIGDPKTWPTGNYTWVGGGPATINFYSNGTNSVLWPGVSWVQECDVIDSCEFCTDQNRLDCEQTRLARLMTTPCLNLKLGTQGGTLANGTYFAVIAYLIKGQRVTDYFSQSNNQFIFTVNDLEGSLDLEVNADTQNFDEFELVIVQNINQGTVAKRIGAYSTRTNRVSIDQINPSNVTIPLEFLPIQTPVYEKSDQMTEVNNYLLRVGPTTKFDFNYQPLANQIRTKWASVEYPADYYVKGGNKTNYLRDEVYCFFIRWVYNTGDKSSSYHIPGRAPRNFTIPGGATVSEVADLDADSTLRDDDKVFEVYNTASIDAADPLINTQTNDGGTIIAVGDMGFWQSEEVYPDNRPDIWNSSFYSWTGACQTTAYDLCGKNIRHHKFPEDYIEGNNTTAVTHFRTNPNTATTGDQNFIRIMGVFFENIIYPKDNDGVLIPGIVGYEILRGSREGNKTIIAKGMVNNFRTYNIRGSAGRGRTGLYPNYPFNTIVPLGNVTGFNNANQHNYLYNDPYIFNKDDDEDKVNQNMPTDIFTFHSPDTMFRTPFLSTTEVKLYGTLKGYSTQQFQYPEGHPEFKLISDACATMAIVAGIAEAVVSLIGKRTVNQPDFTGILQQLAAGNTSPTQIAALTALTTLPTPLTSPVSIYNSFLDNYTNGTAILDALTMVSPINGGYENTLYAEAQNTFIDAINGVSGATGLIPLVQTGSVELPKWAYLDPITRTLGALNQIAFYFAEGFDVAIKLAYAFTNYRQYALQQVAHGLYSDMVKKPNDLFRLKIEDSFYMRDNLQEVNRYQTQNGFWRSYTINNLKRSDAVVLRTKTGPYVNPAFPDGINRGFAFVDYDKSLVTLGTLFQNAGGGYTPPGVLPAFDNPTLPFSLPIASHYVAIKGRVRNQYGQLDSVRQIVITPCEQKENINYLPQPEGPFTYPSNPPTLPCAGKTWTNKVITRTPVLFNGDTYINRYTEKNNMMFFYDWLYDQPDGFEFNYFLRNMIPDARFALNSQIYASSNITDTFSISNPIPGTGGLPSAFYMLDFYNNPNQYYDYEDGEPKPNNNSYKGLFSVKEAYFYLANSSIRDFYVESDVLVDFRKQGLTAGEKHYDPYRYTDYLTMFSMNPTVMGRNSAYIYDYSLSVSKLYNQYFSAGSIQSRYYDPEVSELCYEYYPDRIIYSLPQQDEAIKDSWFVYLINNYKEFKSQLSGVKSINKSGIIITFKNDSPVMYQGVDTLQTDLSTKITIGDGGLFSQPVQSVSNADKSFEYGSSQNRLSIISTPVGIFYMSQNQGKIFTYGQGLQEISQAGMKWWFTLFLPYKLTEDFPDYPWQDNPVAGIGCQTMFDNTDTVIYFAKKDYKLKDEYKGQVVYIPLNRKSRRGDYFTLIDVPGSIFQLGDPTIFEDASWTISYDPKNQFWISFHDWHPDLSINAKDRFLTTKNNTIWKHNNLCSDYCTFYGESYPFEVEIPIITGQSVMTTRSIEYILECYRRSSVNCVDQHHVLDYNFDRAVIYNSEQVSGYLSLNLFPKNNITLSLDYPKFNAAIPMTYGGVVINQPGFDILFSKEENKYRINQFWDITKDRGEFPIGSNYPPTGPIIPGTTILNGNYNNEYTWITAADGYTRVLNINNLDHDKNSLERKKFRHYLNFLNLRKNDATDVNMIVKITNSKNLMSFR